MNPNLTSITVNLSRKLFKQDIVSNLRSIRRFSVSSTCNMRYVQYRNKNGGQQYLGAQLSIGGDIIDISSVDSTIPNNLVDFLNLGQSTYEKARRIIANSKSVTSISDAILLSPVTNSDKVVCVGLNYTGHCDEQNMPYPKEPMFFSKFSSVVVGPNDNVIIPPITNQVDWEVELAVVIGRQAKAIRPDQAQEYIFGYTVAQDISARDWQKSRNNGQFLLGKSMDTFCPLGPAIVTKTKLDPSKLAIKSWVNGVLKQSGNTSELIFKIDFLVSYLSQIVTLYPGDVILTGTPAGVGMHRKPAEYLKPGDVLESEIEGIGRLRNVISS
ncbi:fumarylacetoacetate hydrolase domain-containing protein 2 [Euwallacea similis]|uniref:fumarylacetoacetate hydrolase domain-containing protein 2 n=1 Tax=Euwallacea similis TaxID=1736056 RepID=UPI003450A293